MAQMLELLPSKCETLSSNPSTTKKPHQIYRKYLIPLLSNEHSNIAISLFCLDYYYELELVFLRFPLKRFYTFKTAKS
jgi:hypothetical protein